LAAGAALPTSSSLDGGIEELPEFRDSRCSNRANFATSCSLAASNSEICDAIEEIWAS
jgi:hypothetical protein